MTYNEYAQVLEAVNPDTGELYQPEDLNVVSYEEVGVGMLQDAIWADGARLESDEAYRDIATRFLAASIQGWAYCRDDPESCRDITVAAGSQLGDSHQLWQMNEVNKLIWPAESGIGFIDEEAWNRTVEIALNTPNLEGATVLTQPPTEGAYTNEYRRGGVGAARRQRRRQRRRLRADRGHPGGRRGLTRQLHWAIGRERPIAQCRTGSTGGLGAMEALGDGGEERPAHAGHLVEGPLQAGPVEAEDLEGRRRDHVGVAGGVGEQAELADDVAGRDMVDDLAVAADGGRAGEHDVELARRRALADQRLTGLDLLDVGLRGEALQLPLGAAGEQGDAGELVGPGLVTHPGNVRPALAHAPRAARPPGPARRTCAARRRGRASRPPPRRGG